jgi:hypothetical protein
VGSNPTPSAITFVFIVFFLRCMNEKTTLPKQGGLIVVKGEQAFCVLARTGLKS